MLKGASICFLPGSTQTQKGVRDISVQTIWNLPNIISLIRVAFVPVFILLLLGTGRAFSIITAVLFAMVSLTDWLDGYLARRMGVVTNLGKFLDPLADKLLLTTILVMLIPLGRVPAWIAALIIGREVAVTGLRAVAASDGIVISASKAGKYKTAFQIAAILALVIHYPFWGINFHTIGALLLWVALALTILSGVQYFINFLKCFDGRPSSEN